MTNYEGPPVGPGVVQLGAPVDDDFSLRADGFTWHTTGGRSVSIEEEIERWTAAARVREDILMFHITERGETAGQIFLHDIDARPGEAMVGYHLVSDDFRGRGLGSEALALLVGYVRDRTALSTLVLTTAGDNKASQRVAEKAGFERVGAPWEDPTACLYKLRLSR